MCCILLLVCFNGALWNKVTSSNLREKNMFLLSVIWTTIMRYDRGWLSVDTKEKHLWWVIEDDLSWTPSVPCSGGGCQLIGHRDLTVQGPIRDLGRSVTPNVMLRRRLSWSQTQFVTAVQYVATVTSRGTWEVCYVCSVSRWCWFTSTRTSHKSSGHGPVLYITKSPPSELMDSSAEQSQVLDK